MLSVWLFTLDAELLAVEIDYIQDAVFEAGYHSNSPQDDEQDVLVYPPVTGSHVCLVLPEGDQFYDCGEEQDERGGEDGSRQIHEGLKVRHGHSYQNWK